MDRQRLAGLVRVIARAVAGAGDRSALACDGRRARGWPSHVAATRAECRATNGTAGAARPSAPTPTLAPKGV